MKCISCGREIPAGNVYCPLCGKEAQIISDKSVLEEDLLKILMEEDVEVEAGLLGEQQHNIQKKEKQEKQKKKRNKTILVTIIIIIVCVAAVFVFFGFKKSNSYDNLFEKAEIAYHTGKYEDAIEYTVKAIDKQPESLDAYLLLGDIYVQLDDVTNAENCYFKVISIDESSLAAYESLLKLYTEANDYASIEELFETVSNEDSALMKLFDDYIVSIPTVNVAGGEYDEPLKLELSAKRGLKIYYTIDGSTPTADSTLYDKMFELTEEGITTLQAVCIDENGNVSKVLIENYELVFTAPDVPHISPDGGEFDKLTKVTITAQSGTTVYYTWDDSTPTSKSKCYTKPITIPEGNNILSVIAIDDVTKKSSEVFKTNFIYYPVTEETPGVE